MGLTLFLSEEYSNKSHCVICQVCDREITADCSMSTVLHLIQLCVEGATGGRFLFLFFFLLIGIPGEDLIILLHTEYGVLAAHLSFHSENSSKM